MSHDSPPSGPLVIAHRTTMGHAPENTLLGIRKALELGCDGVECDVRLSADSAPVLTHDDQFDRATNATGRVADFTIEQLAEVDAGKGEPVPTLRDALELIDGRMLFAIELKITEGDDVAALCEAVLAEVQRANALPWTWFWSFDSETVSQLAARAPRGGRIAHLCLSPTDDIWRIAAEHNLDGISMWAGSLSEDYVTACRAHDLAAFVWTVNEAEVIERCIRLGATGIVSDFPERVQSALPGL